LQGGRGSRALWRVSSWAAQVMLNINSCIERCYRDELLTEDEVEEVCDRLKLQRKPTPTPTSHKSFSFSPFSCKHPCVLSLHMLGLF
jgi:hypothetical protein